MRLLARTGLLAGMVEGLLAEQVRGQAERSALLDRVRDLEVRLAAIAQGPLLSADAFSRIQRAQQTRGDLRAEIRRLRERYADSEGAEDTTSSGPLAG
jgi:hypothetical protein